MTTNEEIAYIRQKLSEPEILCALAEEAAELAQAALKLRRALDGTNPTPKTIYQCIDALTEEAADVWVCLEVCDDDSMEADAYDMALDKLHRWAERLSEKEDKEDGKN